MKFDEDCINVLKKVLFMEFFIFYGAFAYSVAGAQGVLVGMILILSLVIIGLVLIEGVKDEI